MHVNYITLIQLLLPEITSITTDTLGIIIYIIMYHFTWVTITCIFFYPRSRIFYYTGYYYFMYL